MASGGPPSNLTRESVLETHMLGDAKNIFTNEFGHRVGKILPKENCEGRISRYRVVHLNSTTEPEKSNRALRNDQLVRLTRRWLSADAGTKSITPIESHPSRIVYIVYGPRG
ncbi:uncharacterized protein LOC113464308 [Ceratina calcarata]|uniref:Uncharacterized protein LOC113464308 n=1 Tax=Ceratina calcarata TaxID=156304 RepID=A0AAJ7WBA9_9HYME|nr:uncharacterized protein LOC113464308 [Ceratina calcarata]